MAKHTIEYYESIVEASLRGELWGLDKYSNNTSQLELNFDFSTTK